MRMNHPSALQDALDQIIDLNMAFCEAIATGDWQGATELERRRRLALQDTLRHPITRADRTRVIDTLQTLLQTDRELVEKLAAARDHCSQQISRQQLGRTASASYLDNGVLLNSPRMMQ